MARFIILVDQPNGTVSPIVSGDTEWDESIAVFTELAEAKKVAADNMLCNAYPYLIINLDDVEDLS